MIFLVESEDVDNVVFPLGEKCPVSLLPIANIPLLAHQLRSFHLVGFNEAIVVCEEDAKRAVQDVMKAYLPGMQANIVCVPESSSSVEMLAAARPHVMASSDFIVVGSDVITDCAVHEIIDLHRLRGAAVTMLAIPRMLPITKEGEKPKDAVVTDLVGLDSSVHWGSIRDAEQAQQRVLYLASPRELDDVCSIRTSMLTHCPSIRMHSNLVDANIYIFAHWVFELLDQPDRRFTSIKNDLVTYLVRHQHRSSTKGIPEVARAAHAEYLKVQDMSPRVKALESPDNNQSGSDVVQCYALVPGDCWGIRLDSMTNFMEMNKQVTHSRAAGSTAWFARQEHECPHRSGGNRKMFDADTLVGKGLDIQERSTIKRSVVGKNCKIGTGVKIANCVLMDNVVVEDGAKLEASVICTDAVIGASANLMRCRIGYGESISAKSSMKDEVYPLLEM